MPTAGSVTSVSALIKYALDRRRRSASGGDSSRMRRPLGSDRLAGGRGIRVGLARRRTDVRSLLTIRDSNRALVSFGSGACDSSSVRISLSISNRRTVTRSF